MIENVGGFSLSQRCTTRLGGEGGVISCLMVMKMQFVDMYSNGDECPGGSSD